MESFARIVAGLTLLFVAETQAFLDPQGVKCGEKRCTTIEYCSPYDFHCRPCSEACDEKSRNYQPEECSKDCQEYLHDQRYVLRAELGEYEELWGEIRRLRILLIIAISITCIMVLAIFYLLGRAFLRWEKICSVFRRIFSKNGWSKGNNNNNNNGSKKKVQDDPELGRTKQTGLKLAMPTISASVAPSRSTGTNGNGTPNTTSTPLSRRHPSEDTTLDYAYDNPAMTPSPEAAQLRTKRESSF